MAVGEIMAKGLVVIKGDTAHARAEIAKLSAEEQKAARARIKAQEESNAALERSNQRFALYAAGAVAGWAVISKSVKTYEEHLKSLGASGESELKRIQGASNALAGSQKNLEIAIGKVAAAGAGAAMALADMVNQMANIVSGVGALVNALGTGIGSTGTSLIGFAMKYGGPVNQGRALADWGMNQAYGVFGDQGGGFRRWGAMRQLNQEQSEFMSALNPEQEFLKGQYGSWTDNPALNRFAGQGSTSWARAHRNGINTGFMYSEQESLARMHFQNVLAMGGGLLGDLGKGVGIGTTAKKRKAGSGGDDWSLLDDLGLYGGQLFSRAQRQQEELAAAAQGRAAYRKGTSLSIMDRNDIRSSAQEATEAARAYQMDESIRKAMELQGSIDQRESMLAKIFGPVEEFELYTTAWQGLESVVSAGFDAWISGSKSVGQAMREALHGFAKQLAGEALLQALRHGAYALGSLAFGDVRGASAHGLSAAKWAGVAAAAAVVGKVSAPSQGASSNSYAAAGIGGGGGGGSGQTTSLTVVMGDSFAGDSPRYVARKVRRNIDLARQYADYEEQGN